MKVIKVKTCKDMFEPSEMKVMKVKTRELVGAQLDWAAAKAQGVIESTESTTLYYRPSTVWSHGGTIIEREGMTVRRYTDALWDASIGSLDYVADGPTPLVAAIRCFVLSKLGEEVEVPDSLKNDRSVKT